MRALKEAWFEFKGRRSTEFGILLAQMPRRGVAVERVDRALVPGRVGRIWTGGGGYDDVAVTVECHAPDEARHREIFAWLTGRGPLRFSDEPELQAEACVDGGYVRQSLSRRMAGQAFTVSFACAPFRTLYVPSAPVVLTAAGTVENGGTAPSLPRVTIDGSGSFSLSIGGQLMCFQGVEDGVIVDSRLGDVLTHDGAALCNDRAAGALYVLRPGISFVSWTEGDEDESGHVARVTIERREAFF